MNEKFFLRSRAIVGALVTLIAPAFLLFGMDAPDGETLVELKTHLEALIVAGAAVLGAVLAIIGRVKAKTTLTIRPTPGLRSHWLIVPVAFVLIMLVGCLGTMPKSDDPQIAMEQEWVAACDQMGAGVDSAITLRKAGLLDPREIRTMGLIKTIYVETCTGEPQPVGDALKEGAARGAVFSLCPELVWADDITITITLAAVCASRQYLLHELEDAT